MDSLTRKGRTIYHAFHPSSMPSKIWLLITSRSKLSQKCLKTGTKSRNQSRLKQRPSVSMITLMELLKLVASPKMIASSRKQRNLVMLWLKYTHSPKDPNFPSLSTTVRRISQNSRVMMKVAVKIVPWILKFQKRRASCPKLANPVLFSRLWRARRRFKYHRQKKTEIHCHMSTPVRL